MVIWPRMVSNDTLGPFMVSSGIGLSCVPRPSAQLRVRPDCRVVWRVIGISAFFHLDRNHNRFFLTRLKDTLIPLRNRWPGRRPGPRVLWGHRGHRVRSCNHTCVAVGQTTKCTSCSPSSSYLDRSDFPFISPIGEPYGLVCVSSMIRRNRQGLLWCLRDESI